MPLLQKISFPVPSPLLLSVTSTPGPFQHAANLAATPCRFPPSDTPTNRRRFLSATVSNRRSSSSADEPILSWPSWPNPTPYEIFNVSPDTPYDKVRFHQLAKLYHPDLSDSSTAFSADSDSRVASSAAGSSTRLERFRLVVRANEILGNPARRRLYDDAGIGWGPGCAGWPAPSEEDYNAALRRRYEAWRRGPLAGTAMNATWEDWERWYEEQGARPFGQGGDRAGSAHTSHLSLVSILLSVVAVGVVVQSVRIEAHHSGVLERKQQSHKVINDRLRRVQEETGRLGSQEKIERFVRERENRAYAFRPDKYNHVSEQGVEKVNKG